MPPLLRSSVVLAAFALAAVRPRLGFAQAPERLSVAVLSTVGAIDDGRSGACPSAALVAGELRRLMPDVTLETGNATESDVLVADGDGSFSVKVRGQRRRFRDTQRDCMERARHVAVFTVLIVDPLHVPRTVVSGAEEEPEPEKGPIERRAEPPPRFPADIYEPPSTAPGRPATFDLSLGPIAQVAMQSRQQSTTQAGGLGLRMRYGGNFGIMLGVAGLLPTSLQFADAEARATWIPIDLGLSLSQRLSSWEVAFELGAVGALLLVEGEALDSTRRASRLELGGRVGVQVRYWASERAGIYGGLFGLWYPKPYTLEVEGLGKVGETPKGWVGGSLGAVIRL